MGHMTSRARRRHPLQDNVMRIGGLCLLLAIGALAVAGPYGFLAWGENMAVLEKRESRIAKLEAERDQYQNLVELLDPEHVDPDLATELARRNLNVAHPDEYIIEFEGE